MSDGNDNAEVKAAELGLIVVAPGPRQLLADIDTEADYLYLQTQISRLVSNGVAITITRDTPSKSGLPKRHITLEVDHDISDIERIALQACLGSDRVREILSLCRVYRGTSPATVFFELPSAERAPDIGAVPVLPW